MSESELKSFFQAGAQIYDMGPNNTRIPIGWGLPRNELIDQGFTKQELEKYFKKGVLGKTQCLQSRGKDIKPGGALVVYYYPTSEKIRTVV